MRTLAHYDEKFESKHTVKTHAKYVPAAHVLLRLLVNTPEKVAAGWQHSVVVESLRKLSRLELSQRLQSLTWLCFLEHAGIQVAGQTASASSPMVMYRRFPGDATWMEACLQQLFDHFQDLVDRIHVEDDNASIYASSVHSTIIPLPVLDASLVALRIVGVFNLAYDMLFADATVTNGCDHLPLDRVLSHIARIRSTKGELDFACKSLLSDRDAVRRVLDSIIFCLGERARPPQTISDALSVYEECIGLGRSLALSHEATLITIVRHLSKTMTSDEMVG